QAQTAFHLPADASTAAVVDGEDAVFVPVVEAEPVPEEIIIGKLDPGIQHIGLCFHPCASREFSAGVTSGVSGEFSASGTSGVSEKFGVREFPEAAFAGQRMADHQ